MERLTKRSPETTNENGVCCTHFHSPECFMVEGNCSAGCKWEEAAWSRLAAYEDGRLFLLPMEPGRSMLCQEYFERPWVMKNVTLCVQYKSSAGIIFYMGYDVFRGLVERGRITPLSQEGEEMLEGKANV